MIKGKLVLVPFPFDDFSAVKVRPAVCLTDAIGPHHHVIVAFMSSKKPDDPMDTDIHLHSGMADFALTGLRGPGTLRLHRLATVTTSILQRELGRLSAEMQVTVTDKLRKLFE